MERRGRGDAGIAIGIDPQQSLIKILVGDFLDHAGHVW